MAASLVGFTTTTSTRPAAPGVVMIVIAVGVTLRTVCGVAPKRTATPGRKLKPVIVTAVVPAVLPVLGVNAAITGVGGAGLRVKSVVVDASRAPTFVRTSTWTR